MRRVRTALQWSLAIAAAVLTGCPFDADQVCGEVELLALQPREGAVVPMGAVVRAVYDPGPCSSEALTAELTCAGPGVPRSAEASLEDLETVVIAFELADVAVGDACVLEARDERDGEVLGRRAFSVGDVSPAPLGDPSLREDEGDLAYVVTTRGEPTTEHHGTVNVDAAPDPLGMSILLLRGPGGALCGIAAAPAAGGRTAVDVRCDAPDADEVCFTVEQVDGVGNGTFDGGCVASRGSDG